MTEPAPNSDETRQTGRPRWSRSIGVAAGGAAALTLAAVGLIAGRIDVAILALPLVAAITLGRERRPARDDEVTARLVLGTTADSHVPYTLEFTLPRGVETVILRYRVLGGTPRELVVAGGLSDARSGGISGRVPLMHSGPQELVRFDYRLLSEDALAASRPQGPIIGARVITPEQQNMRELPLPPRLPGMIGEHPSARLGQGGEFRDVHLFAPGDRLRRIDWKTTARRGRDSGELYVRRTNAVADATVIIVMDSRDDIGEQIAQWSTNAAVEKGLSSLDVAREAASSIATAYIATGDRVGFQDLSSRERMLGHSAGNRHLWRLLRAVETSGPSSLPYRRVRPPILPSGAIVYLLSSLLDNQSVLLALQWHGSGHRVIAVDVLPPPRFDRTNRYERVAHRMVLADRDDRIRQLRAHGVEVLRWHDRDSQLPVATRLALLSRPARRAGSAARR